MALAIRTLNRAQPLRSVARSSGRRQFVSSPPKYNPPKYKKRLTAAITIVFNLAGKTPEQISEKVDRL